MKKNNTGYDIAIVGAGIAGLAAARRIEEFNQLHKQNKIRYIVLEATDRIGGRVKTEYIKSETDELIMLDHGAQWLHNSTHPNHLNPLYEYACREGADYNAVRDAIKQKDWKAVRDIVQPNLIHDSMAVTFIENGQRKPILPKNERLKQFEHALEKHFRNNGQDMSVAEFLKIQGMSGYEFETTYGQTEHGAPLSDLSIEAIYRQMPAHQGDFIKTGTHTIVENLKTGVKNITKKAIVTTIDYSNPDSTQLTLENGKNITAKKCIITVPLGVLKSDDISFTPSLPEEHETAIKNLGAGSFNKIFFLASPDYNPAGRKHFNPKINMMPYNTSTHLDISEQDHSFIMVTGDRHPRLVTAMMGGHEGEMLNGGSSRAETIARSAIRSAYPSFGNQPADANFTTIGQTDWGAKPHTKCSYSFVTPGNYSAKEALAKPVDNKIFFAGEACGGTHPNTKEDWGEQMAGAYISGIRAASNALENLVKQDIKKETSACDSELLALSSVPYRDIFPEHAHSHVAKINSNSNRGHIR